MLMRYQVIRYRVYLAGVALVLGTAATAIPAIAQTRPASISEPLISQLNNPEGGVPSALYHDVEGVVVSLNGDQVQLQSGNGQKTTYMVPVSVQRRYSMAPGSKIVLTVRDSDRDVVDVGVPGQ